jgi:hypothetical protein
MRRETMEAKRKADELLASTKAKSAREAAAIKNKQRLAANAALAAQDSIMPQAAPGQYEAATLYSRELELERERADERAGAGASSSTAVRTLNPFEMPRNYNQVRIMFKSVFLPVGVAPAGFTYRVPQIDDTQYRRSGAPNKAIKGLALYAILAGLTDGIVNDDILVLGRIIEDSLRRIHNERKNNPDNPAHKELKLFYSSTLYVNGILSPNIRLQNQLMEHLSENKDTRDLGSMTGKELSDHVTLFYMRTVLFHRIVAFLGRDLLFNKNKLTEIDDALLNLFLDEKATSIRSALIIVLALVDSIRTKSLVPDYLKAVEPDYMNGLDASRETDFESMMSLYGLIISAIMFIEQTPPTATRI